MILKLLFGAVFLAVIALSPSFVKAQRNGPTKKSLAIKMAAATGYLAVGALAAAISNNYSHFALLIGIALLLCWIGDLFLHLTGSRIFFGVGFLAFFSAHFVFIAAYLLVIKSAAPDRPLFSLPEIIAVVLFDVFFLVFSKLIGTEFKGWLKVPIVLYGTVIVFMLCKAAVMGVSLIQANAPCAVISACIAVCGAALFVASDFSIAVLIFNQKYKKSYPLKMFNIVTYFLAVLLLASLLLFVR